MAGALLMRGTLHKNRQQIQDETDRLKAQINVTGGIGYASANIRTYEATWLTPCASPGSCCASLRFPATSSKDPPASIAIA
jgi:hypothetical protein